MMYTKIIEIVKEIVMSIHIKWHIQDKLLYLKPDSIIDFEILKSSMQDVLPYFEESHEPLVHLILDGRDVANEVKSLKNRVDAIRPVLQHPKCGWLIMIGQTNPIAKFLASTATQVFKARFRSFNTLEEGISFLEQATTGLGHIPTFEPESE